MNQILVHQEGACALVRIVGRGTFRNSVALRDYGKELVDGLPPGGHILLDMKTCQALDSTFMGMLASWTHALKKAEKPSPVMIDVQTNVAECMTTLGLSHVIAWSPAGESPEAFRSEMDACSQWDELECEEETENDTAHRMFDAHQKLVEIEDENQSRFKDVLDYLGTKLGKRNESDPP